MIFITKHTFNSFCLKPKRVSLIINVVYERTDSLILISCQCTYSGEIKFRLRKYSTNAAAINVIAMVIIRNIQATRCFYAINTAQMLI